MANESTEEKVPWLVWLNEEGIITELATEDMSAQVFTTCILNGEVYGGRHVWLNIDTDSDFFKTPGMEQISENGSIKVSVFVPEKGPGRADHLTAYMGRDGVSQDVPWCLEDVVKLHQLARRLREAAHAHFREAKGSERVMI